jgi:LCP family protein required for cell wall assembly
VARPRRRWPQRLLSTLGVFVLTAFLLSSAGVFYAKRTLDSVASVDLSGVLTPEGKSIDNAGMGPTTIENYLIVGSDSRAGIDPSDLDAGAIGNAQEVTGQRSDTIMILRFDPATNSSALLSLPRDLWVPIAGTNGNGKINGAFSKGKDVLINTIQTDFGIPIHHYVEVNFEGFKKIVDAIGGVSLYFDVPARDTTTGFEVITPGCNELDGTQALAFARSRHYQTFTNGRWREDPSADLGRIARQQEFVQQAFRKALTAGSSSPTALSQLINAAVSDITVDKQLDILGLANRLRKLGSGGVKTFTLPAHSDTVGNQSVLIEDNGKAQPIVDYFKGAGPEPTDPTTTPGNAVPLRPTPAAQQPTPAQQESCS